MRPEDPLKQCRIISPEEISALQSKAKELGLHSEKQTGPTPDKPKPETPEQKLKKEMSQTLNALDGILKMKIQTSASRLNSMQRPAMLKRQGEFVNYPKFSKEQIESVEDQILGYKMQSECLTQAVQALNNEQVPPPDLMQTLQLLKKELEHDPDLVKQIRALQINLGTM